MRGSVIRRGSTWSVRFDEHTAEGRKQRRRGGFATRREAQAFLADTLSRVGDGSYVPPARQTVAEFLAEWLPAAAATVRPLTANRYDQVARRQIVPGIGSVRLQALSGGHLTALYAELERQGLAPETRRLVHTVLHRALKDAVRWGKLRRNPADLVDPPARDWRTAQTWTASELARFLEHVRSDRLYGLWRLAATTGARRGELLGVTWRALDLEGARVSIDQQLLPDRTFGPPKSTRSRRTISLDGETVDALVEHRGQQLGERDRADDAYMDGDLVFCDELGGPISPRRLSDWFHRHREAAGIPTGSLHTLRHTVSTLALTSGVPVHIVAARLGDAPTVVLRTYSHLLPQSDEVAAEQVAAQITTTH